MRHLFYSFKTLVLCSLALSVPWRVAAQVNNGGRSAYEVLKLSPVSRAIGVGGAYTALGDDVGAIFYNPAGLASVLTNELNITYLSLYEGFSYESVAYAYPVGMSLPSVGGTLAIGAGLLQPGTMERTNDFGVTTGTFSSGDQVFTLAYARAFGDSVHLGLSASLIQQQIDTISSSLFDVSGGLVVLPPFKGMRIGLSVKNLGAQSSGFNLPFTLNAGISYRKYEMFNEQDDGAITAEVALPLQPIEDPTGVKVGVEYSYKWVGSRATVRVGYEFLDHSLDGIGLGVGAGYGLDFGGSVLFIDYAYAPADIFGDTHRVSLTTKF